MASFGGRFASFKEKALFAVACTALVAVAVAALRWEPPVTQLPDEPRMPPPKSAGAVMGADQLYSSGRFEDAWKEGGRFVFVQPAPTRVFTPVALEVPTVAPARPPMALPEPGPFLQNTGTLPRLGDSAALSAPPPVPSPAPAPAPPAPGLKPPAGGGK